MPAAEPEVHAEHDPHLANVNLATEGGHRCVGQMTEIYSGELACPLENQAERAGIYTRKRGWVLHVKECADETRVYHLRHILMPASEGVQS